MSEKEIIRHEIVEEEDSKKKRNLFIGILLLIIAAIAIIGFAMAYFTDWVAGTGQVTAGTLDIVKTTSNVTRYYTDQNNTLIADSKPEYATTGIPNFNPGDAVKISYTVTNQGNKSAWIRDVLHMAIKDRAGTEYDGTNGEAFLIKEAGKFKLYSNFNRALIDPSSEMNDAEFDAAVAKLIKTDVVGANGTLVGTSNLYGIHAVSGNEDPISANPIIMNGSGAGAESETNGVNAHSAELWLYFDSSARNDHQGVELICNFGTQAVQFRNNPAGTNGTTYTEIDWGNPLDQYQTFTLG